MRAHETNAATCHKINAIRHSAGAIAIGLSAILAFAAPASSQTAPGPGAPRTKTAPMPPPPATAPAPLPAETGIWLDHTRRGAIEITPCDNRLCGRIYWLQDPLQKNGQPLVDGNNPDKKKRAVPICGLQIIGGLEQQGNGAWDKGWIYDPEKGESYDLEVKLKGPAQLQILGYMGVKWLSETYVWTRAPANMQRCDVQAATAPTPAPGVRNGTAKAQAR